MSFAEVIRTDHAYKIGQTFGSETVAKHDKDMMPPADVSDVLSLLADKIEDFDQSGPGRGVLEEIANDPVFIFGAVEGALEAVIERRSHE